MLHSSTRHRRGTFFDTANTYGPRTVNRLIADALRPLPRGVIVGTKVGAGRGPRTTRSGRQPLSDRPGDWPPKCSAPVLSMLRSYPCCPSPRDETPTRQ
jgi:hypothetical protein